MCFSLSHASAHDSAALRRGWAGVSPKYYSAGVSPKYYWAFAEATLGVGGRRADRATTKRVALGCAPPAVATASSGAPTVSPNEDSPGLARGWGSGLSGVGVLKLSELQTTRGLVKSVGARRDASLHLRAQRRGIGAFRWYKVLSCRPPRSLAQGRGRPSARPECVAAHRSPPQPTAAHRSRPRQRAVAARGLCSRYSPHAGARPHVVRARARARARARVRVRATLDMHERGHTSSSGQSFSLKTSAGSSQSYSSACAVKGSGCRRRGGRRARAAEAVARRPVAQSPA